MLTKRVSEKTPFIGVAMALILFGAGILAFGLVGWLFNTYDWGTVFSHPAEKVMGGTIILALGYLHLELELIRTKTCHCQ